MKVGLISNWMQTDGCGVGNFGLDWCTALIAAGHNVKRLYWHDPLSWHSQFLQQHLLSCDRLLVNWDSGTLPKDEPVPEGAVVFVHHTYRGVPEGLDRASRVLCPMRGVLPGAEYFPYPISTYRASQSLQEPVQGTIGVTTIRREGLDYLSAAAARRGLRVMAPDRWRSTEQEIERLAQCQFLAAWYADSPGRSLALATLLAAQRPLLLSTGSQMFEYAKGSEEIYWTPYTNQDMEIIAEGFDRVLSDCAAGTEKIPRRLAEEWSWPNAIEHLESLW